MRKAFTLVEVIILLVIFIMVALLAIPLSIDDTIQAKHISKWKQVQNGFIEIPTSIRTFSQDEITLQNFVTALVKIHPLNKVVSYKIKYMNGETPAEEYTYKEIYETDSGAALAFNWYENPRKEYHTNRLIYGTIMYDVNGKQGPNIWGKDVFGFNIFKDAIEPFGKSLSREELEFDSSRQGTGLFCSSYYLNGGSF